MRTLTYKESRRKTSGAGKQVKAERLYKPQFPQRYLLRKRDALVRQKHRRYFVMALILALCIAVSLVILSAGIRFMIW